MQWKILLQGVRIQYEVRWWIGEDCPVQASGRLGAIFLQSAPCTDSIVQGGDRAMKVHEDILRRYKVQCSEM